MSYFEAVSRPDEKRVAWNAQLWAPSHLITSAVILIAIKEKAIKTEWTLDVKLNRKGDIES